MVGPTKYPVFTVNEWKKKQKKQSLIKWKDYHLSPTRKSPDTLKRKEGEFSFLFPLFGLRYEQSQLSIIIF